MADKQISELTAVSTPATTDLYVCEQSSTAKKITLSALRNWILKVSGLSSTASSVSDSDYLLLDQSSTPKRILASTLKSYCGGSGGSGVFYAVYNTTPYADVKAAYDAGEIIILKPNQNQFWPLWRYYEDPGTGEVQMNWYDYISDIRYNLSSISGWTTGI